MYEFDFDDLEMYSHSVLCDGIFFYCKSACCVWLIYVFLHAFVNEKQSLHNVVCETCQQNTYCDRCLLNFEAFNCANAHCECKTYFVFE